MIKTLCLVAHPIAYLKYEMNNLIPANQKFLLSDFDILEKVGPIAEIFAT